MQPEPKFCHAGHVVLDGESEVSPPFKTNDPGLQRSFQNMLVFLGREDAKVFSSCDPFHRLESGQAESMVGLTTLHHFVIQG